MPVLNHIHPEPKIGETWKAKDGKTLTIIDERNDIPLVGNYFVYKDIDGKIFYSRKKLFFEDFVEKCQS